MNPYKKVFTELNKKKIKYVIVGGVAVNLYGYSRFTGDIDIMIAMTNTNLDKMDKIANELGYIDRLPIKIQELGDKKKLNNFIKEKGLKAYTFISNKKPQLDIDILVSESINFEKYYKNKSTIKVWETKLPVVSIEDLIKMKKKANRDKDLLDIEALLKLKSMQ